MNKSKICLFAFACILIIVSALSCSQVVDSNPVAYPGSAPFFDFLEINEISDVKKIRSDKINLFVENISEDCVVFSHDYGLQIFTQIDNAWNEIPNLADYVVESEIVLTNASGELPFIIVYLLPDYSKLEKKLSKIRVVLNAFLCKNNIQSDVMVSDYIDIDLEK